MNKDIITDFIRKGFETGVIDMMAVELSKRVFYEDVVRR